VQCSRAAAFLSAVSIPGRRNILHRTRGKRQFYGLVSTLDTGLTQYTYRYSLNAPLKKEQADEKPACKTGLWDKDMSRGLALQDLLDKLCLDNTTCPGPCKERRNTTFVERKIFRK
jgi:hypothetical protein